MKQEYEKTREASSYSDSKLFEAQVKAQKLQKQYETLKADHQKAVEKYEARIKKLKSKKSPQAQQDTIIQDLEKEIQRLKSEAADAEKLAASMEEENKKYKKTIQDLEETNKNLEEKVTKQQQILEEQSKQIEFTESAISIEKQKVKELESKLDQLKVMSC